jgi:hypothetical protein
VIARSRRLGASGTGCFFCQVTHVEHRARVLVARQEITGADRPWAEQFEPGDVVRYRKGSKTLGIEAGEHTRVEQVNAKENLLTVTRDDGERVTYDTVIAFDGDETLEADPETEKMLLDSIAQCERTETVSMGQLLSELQSRE